MLGLPNKSLTWVGNDLAGAAVQARSFDANGYIKYAGGLIIQWGQTGMINGNTATTTLPISYTSNWTYQVIVSGFATNHVAGYGAEPISDNQFTVQATENDKSYRWITIGY